MSKPSVISTIQMLKSVLILILILHAHCADKFLVISSTKSVSVISPSNYVVAVQPWYATYHPNMIGNNAQSLWVNSNGFTPGLKVIFKSVFYSACPQSAATLVIQADDSFTALLSGSPVGSGSGWDRTFTFKLSLQCGMNNLQITVINGGGGPAALTFFIIQNQDNCYQCGVNAFYNLDECQCQCNNNANTCGCQNSLQKRGNRYPYCGCFCRNKIFTVCGENQYFDDLECNCKCLPVYCSSKLQQDPSSCMCRCKAQTCPSDQVWSYSRCACFKKTCPIVTTCLSPKKWDNSSCSCQCPLLSAKCSGNSKFDEQSCSCVGIRPLN